MDEAPSYWDDDFEQRLYPAADTLTRKRIALAATGLLIALLFLLAITTFSNLSPPPWFAVALGAVYAVGFPYAEDRYRRNLAYVFRKNTLGISSGKEKAAIPYDVIKEATVRDNFWEGRIVTLHAPGLTYDMYPQEFDSFLGSLATRAAVRTDYANRKRFLPDTRSIASVVIGPAMGLLLIFAIHNDTSLLGPIFWLGAAVVWVAVTYHGWPYERLPNVRKKSVSRGNMAAAVFIAFIFFINAFFAYRQWSRSPVSAVNLSSLSFSLREPLIMDEYTGLKFEVPQGWKAGRSHDIEHHWVVARRKSADSQEAFLIICVTEKWRVRKAATQFEKDKAMAEAAVETSAHRIADEPYSGLRPEAQTVPAALPGWNAFRSMSILDLEEEALTWWRVSPEHVVTITFEKGDPEDPEVRKFLETFEFEDEVTPAS